MTEINEKDSVTLVRSSEPDSIKISGAAVFSKTYAGNDTLTGDDGNDFLINGEYRSTAEKMFQSSAAQATIPLQVTAKNHCSTAAQATI